MSNDKIPVILDTDIGSDIDDAVALAYLLLHPRCDLIGITTCTGNTCRRAALARFICLAAGRPHIPIFAGINKPLGNGPGQPETPQFDAIRGREPTGSYGNPDGSDALRFLAETIRSRPSEINLLTIGPLTNLGALFQQDPEMPRQVESVVSMAGVFGLRPGLPEVEHNIRCDPLAAKIFFDAVPPGKLTCVGLDVTLQCTMSASECRQRFQNGGPTLCAVAELAEIWFRGRESITFHDPLAAVLLFEPEICDCAAGNMSVELLDARFMGRTKWTRNKTGRMSVASKVDVDQFFEAYFRSAAT